MRLNTQMIFAVILFSIELVSSQEARCSAPDSGRNFTSWQGIIHSPGYDGGAGNSHYPPGENCNWNIVIPDVILATPYFKLNLTFMEFNLGHNVAANKDSACPESGDYLQILGLRPGKSQPICRDDGFPAVASEFTRKLQIKFIYDDEPDTGDRGFAFRYFFPDHPCAKCKAEDTCDDSLPADQIRCVNPCATYQCGHGQCHINGTNGQPYCKCNKCYHGPQCFRFYECRNGECLDNSQYFNRRMCNCTEGIKESPCDEDPCQSKPCLNQGTCKPDSVSLYKCTCSDRYMGDNCERRNYCFENPCKNGDCESLADRHKCNCAPGFRGKNCDIPNVQSDLCPETCIDLTCKDPEKSNLECSYGCVDGYWGNRCYNKCPVNCATCHRQFGARIENRECYTCQDGFYNNATAKECTLTCLPQCRACNNGIDCTACSDGFYLDNSQCKPCPERCAECTSDDVCTACASEYYTGTLCENCVVGRFGNTCKADEAASTSAGTIAGISVGGTIGLVIVVLLIVIIALMYKRKDPTRAKMRKTDENDVEPPKNIYDDLKMEGAIGSSGDYDILDEKSRIRDNKPRTDETPRHQYTNIAI